MTIPADCAVGPCARRPRNPAGRGFRGKTGWRQDRGAGVGVAMWRFAVISALLAAGTLAGEVAMDGKIPRSMQINVLER